MKKIESLIIPGIPISQGRPRLARSGHCFDPNARQKKDVRAIMCELWKEPKVESAHVSFIFCMPIPKGMLKKGMNLKRHGKKPDVDNLMKFYLDCLTGIAWEDDSCVSIAGAIKIYSNTPRTIVGILETSLSLDLLHDAQSDEQSCQQICCQHDF